MSYYDASKEFAPTPVTEVAKGHPRPRTGATAKKRRREYDRQAAAKAVQAAAPAGTKKKK